MNNLFDDFADQSATPPFVNSNTPAEPVEAVACARRSFCRSPYCKACTSRYARSCEDAVNHHVRTCLPDETEQRKKLFLVTPLIGACEIDDIEHARRLKEDGREAVKALKRSIPHLFNHGAFQVEIFKLGESNRRKTQVLRTILEKSGVKNIDNSKSYVLIHSHSIMALHAAEAEKVRKILKRFFPLKYAVEVKGFFKDKPIEDSVHDITKYFFKPQTQYKTDLEGHCYSKALSENDRQAYVRMYEALMESSGKGLILYNHSSRFSSLASSNSTLRTNFSSKSTMAQAAPPNAGLAAKRTGKPPFRRRGQRISMAQHSKPAKANVPFANQQQATSSASSHRLRQEHIRKHLRVKALGTKLENWSVRAEVSIWLAA